METSRLRVMKTKKYALGIDMGTTKVAAVILNTEGDLIVLESQVHGADISTAPGFSEQNISVLVGTVRKILRKFPEELKSKIQTIGLTGQMHGVILLNKDNDGNSNTEVNPTNSHLKGIDCEVEYKDFISFI